MFLLLDSFRSIGRNKGRSFLVACIALCLMSCMGVYMGVIEENRSALAHLSETLPVTVKIVNGDGSSDVGLEISEKLADVLVQAGIQEPVYTARMSGNLEEVNRKNEEKLSDTAITGTNSLDAFSEDVQRTASYADGWDGGFITGNQPVCLVEEEYAQRHGVHVGDTLEMPVYWFDYDKSGYTFQRRKLNEVSLQVIGSFHFSGEVDLIVPVEWMKRAVRRAGCCVYL